MVLVIGLLSAGAFLLVWAPGPYRLPDLMPQGRAGPESDQRGPSNHRQQVRGGTADPALLLDLLGAALEAGSSVEQGLAALAEALDDETAGQVSAVLGALALGVTWEAAWTAAQGQAAKSPPVQAPPGQTLTVLRDALDFAGATGVPSASLLYARAAQLRRRRKRETEKRAAGLGVKLVVPLGVCALPSFVCLGIVPVLYALLPTLA